MTKLFGYAGKILQVNLANGKVVKEPLDEGLARTYLGGRGLNSKTLYDMVKPGTNAFDPENKLIFGTGPLTGLAPASGRHSVSALSPDTTLPFIGNSTSGGDWGPELKLAGYDQLIIHGRAHKPTYLWIDDGTVELRDATHIWGRDTYLTREIITEEIGDSSVNVACIGRGGENLVRFGAITNFRGFAGRMGLGAVMGSKNLKAVAVRGSGCLEVAYPDRFEKAAKEMHELMVKKLDDYERLASQGTPRQWMDSYEAGFLPTRHNQSGLFDDPEKLSGKTFSEKFFLKRTGCFNCPLCDKLAYVIREGPYRGLYPDAIEFETIAAFGARCVCDNPEFIVKAGDLCNRYGLDIISTGEVISFAMECRQRGIITREDTDGIDLSWGNTEAIITMIEKISRREGFGNILAEDVKRAAEKIGKGAEKYAFHVKGVPFIGIDPRVHMGFGLAFMVADVRPGFIGVLLTDELAAELGLLDEAKGGSFPREHALRTEGKGRLTRWSIDFGSYIECLVVCYRIMYSRSPLVLIELLSAATGWEFNERAVLKIGERVANLVRAFDVQVGMSRKDDTYPERFLKEPMPDGPAKGHVFERKPMLDEYYEERGWNKNGVPTREKLEELGLKNVAGDLEKLGKLPHST